MTIDEDVRVCRTSNRACGNLTLALLRRDPELTSRPYFSKSPCWEAMTNGTLLSDLESPKATFKGILPDF